ncbi:MAG: c-type cytochrome [Burkholderiaceae bacterium]
MNRFILAPHTLPSAVKRTLSWALLSVMLALFAGCGAGSETLASTTGPAVSTGAALYVERGCAGCHGADGKGITINSGAADTSPTVIPALTFSASVAELTSIIATSMPPQSPGSCVSDCATQIAQYVFDSFTDKAAPAQTGAALYVERGCAGCHGANGMGVSIFPALTAATTVAQLTTTIAGTMPPTAIGSCGGTCSTLLAQYVYDNFTIKTVPPPVATGASLFVAQGCTACHGTDGKGLVPLTAARTVAQLADSIATRMPPAPATPGSCTGACATLVSQYIFDNFTDKTVATTLIADPLNGLPTGTNQRTALCSRLATRNVNDRVRTAFCNANPTITSLTQLQTALGLAFPANPQAGRGNNGNAGNGPAFALSGHSSSLVLRSVSAINPRAILFTPPTGNPIPGFVAMGFVRGDQFAEIIAHDPTSGALDFYLARFTQACNNTVNGCTPGDLLTPAVESNWLTFQIYDEGDLKNTTVDCTQCHQPGGPATRRILRMQELQNPWNHFFRDNRVGGQALIADYRAAKGNEGYAGIPGALISSSDPALLEDLVRDNGFGNQPNQFNSANIENQVNQTPGQPQNNDVAGASAAWNTIFNRAVAGQAIPVPYHDIKITESATLATMTQAYTNFRAGTLTASALPDLRNVYKTTRLFEIAGIAPRPGLNGAGVVTEMCTQCHNSTLDQNITRARFNVNLAAMSNGSGGVLTAAERDAEIGVAITRLLMPANDVRKMPPESMKTMSLADINLVASYLCTQATNRATIAQCALR